GSVFPSQAYGCGWAPDERAVESRRMRKRRPPGQRSRRVEVRPRDEPLFSGIDGSDRKTKAAKVRSRRATQPWRHRETRGSEIRPISVRSATPRQREWHRLTAPPWEQTVGVGEES